ncbi:hypothetical protein vseg_007358 [Gypsophila vaccaria]
MDFDEFQESDMMFSDYSSDQSVESNHEDDNNIVVGRNDHKHYYNLTLGPKLKSRKNIPKAQRRVFIRSSLPVNIPSSVDTSSRQDNDDVACFGLFDDNDDDDNDDGVKRLPPHLIVERRVSGEMARSFSPLKGRNLCDVRDSILRMTGFLER